MKFSRPSVIMVEPTYFSIEQAINPHMVGPDGKLKSVDKEKAQVQWNTLKAKFLELGVEVDVLPGVSGLPDMVFAANQSFVFVNPRDGAATVILGQMRSTSRRPEVKFFADWYKAQGFKIEKLNDPLLSFEGTGDALIQPGQNIIWGGFGPRTDRAVYAELVDRWGLNVIALKLVRPEFYHLDTCLAILDGETVVVQPEAFDSQDLNIIRRHFGRVIEVGLEENLKYFAANLFCHNGRDVIIQHGAKGLCEKLAKLDFTIHTVDTDEFIKSGGSVFCMKMALPVIKYGTNFKEHV